MPKEVSFTKLEGSKFPLGRTVVTPNALVALTPEDVLTALSHHAGGDWGELDEHDRAVNERGLREEGRLVSVYRSADGLNRFYVITEWDRSLTTVLLPEDY